MATTEERSDGRKRGVEPPGRAAAANGIFAVRGEYWTLGYGGTTFPLKDIKGLSYIQRLLQHPVEEFHSLDLLSGTGSTHHSDGGPKTSARTEGTDSVGGLGDSGELLDAQAKQEYKRKLRELNEELEDLRERGNHERAEQVAAEIDFLKREIARAVGLGGRDRRAGSASERARLNATRAIKAALQKISERHPSMGELLERSIRTGSFCSYAPDPRNQVNWQFSERSPEASRAVASSVPLISRREMSLMRSLSERTAFVGREAESSIMRRFLNQAQDGAGGVLMIDGAAGVGKTRIAQEFSIEASQKGFLVRAGSCYDRGDSVPFVPFVEILEEALAQAPSPHVFREALGDDAAEIARLLPQLRRLFPDIPPPLEIPPEQSRRLLFHAAADFLARTARSRPVVLLFDDLQWADEGTSSLLSYLAPLITKMPVLIVGTYRDSEVDPTRPLAKTLDELIRLHAVERLSLSGLPQNAVAGMLRALSGREPPKKLVSLIYSETEGNPFFVEELFHHLVEQGKLIDSAGEFRRDLMIEDVDVPRSLRLVIGRRLARVSADTQKILGAAAVIGRSFTFELLEASTRIGPDRLLDQVEEGERAGLIHSTLDYPEALFQFSHELVRQAVLGGLSAPRRQRLHLNVADALERLNVGAIEEHINERAYHLWQAGGLANSEATITCLATAARRALEQGTYETAAQHSRNALDIFERLTTPDRVRLARIELALQTVTGSALMPSKGYASNEVERAFTRAKELCTEMDGSPENIPVLLGLGVFFLVRARYEVVREVSEQPLRLAERENDNSAAMEAHLRAGIALFYQGDLESALNRIQRVLALYDRQKHQLHAAIYGQDPAMAARVCGACILWLLGFPDQARSYAETGMQIATEIQHSLSLVYAYDYSAMLYGWLSEGQRVEDLVSVALRISREEGFAFWSAVAMVFHGSALTERGEFEAGIREISEGLRQWESSGALAPGGGLLLLLAGAQLKNRDLNEAKATLAKAARSATDTSERFLEAEIYRLRGELMLASSEPSPSECTNAELQFGRAIEIAQRQSAKSLELRAKLSLARLFERQGKSGLGYRIVKEMYSKFTEGFETADLREADALLRSLSR